ncbi:hypothetical protein ABPG72_018223 [Tetrahymena utriculariae]
MFYLILYQFSCQPLSIPQPCAQVKMVSFSLSPTSNFYFLQLQTIILVLDFNQNEVAQIKIQTNIVDFLMIANLVQNSILAILDNTSNLSFFNLDLNKFENQLLIQQKLNNFNPTNLVLINQITDSSNQLNQIQIIAYFKQLQSLTLNITNQNSLAITKQYYLKPFQRKFIDMQLGIQSMDANDSNNLITSCSNNQQIMTWSYSTKLSYSRQHIIQRPFIPNNLKDMFIYYTKCLFGSKQWRHTQSFTIKIPISNPLSAQYKNCKINNILVQRQDFQKKHPHTYGFASVICKEFSEQIFNIKVMNKSFHLIT